MYVFILVSNNEFTGLKVATFCNVTYRFPSMYILSCKKEKYHCRQLTKWKVKTVLRLIVQEFTFTRVAVLTN